MQASSAGTKQYCAATRSTCFFHDKRVPTACIHPISLYGVHVSPYEVTRHRAALVGLGSPPAAAARRLPHLHLRMLSASWHHLFLVIFRTIDPLTKTRENKTVNALCFACILTASSFSGILLQRAFAALLASGTQLSGLWTLVVRVVLVRWLLEVASPVCTLCRRLLLPRLALPSSNFFYLTLNLSLHRANQRHKVYVNHR